MRFISYTNQWADKEGDSVLALFVINKKIVALIKILACRW